MLKIIINNSDTFYRNALSQGLETKSISLKPSSQDPFLFDFQETSANLHDFRAQDLDHELSCKIILERKEVVASLDEEDEVVDLIPVVACDFPPIDAQKIFDDYLQAMTIIQFQLKILEQLLLFCEDKDATHLFLNFNESNLEYMEIYQRFAISQEEIITERGEQTELIIPTDVEIYDEVIDFMDDVDKKFRQALWRDQKVNPAFRKYLIEHSLPVN